MTPASSILMMVLTAATVLVAVALFSGAIVLSIVFIHRWRGWWRLAASLPAAALAALGAVIVVSVSRDSTSRNLWPLVLILWAAGAFLFLGLLAVARRLFHGGA